MIFFDDDKEKENNDLIDENQDNDFVEDDDIRIVFKENSNSNVKKVILDEEEEEIPQENEEYQIKSQLIYEETESLAPISVAIEMRRSFLEYAMSVIVARALPDARDGLKPVHRRILYSMSELNLTYTSAFKKSARIVGDVLGKFHPHGDSAIYEAMVRMAQDFSLRYPLIDGHGNFGSIDGDEAAAMRYTEARMAKITNEMLDGIKKNTVNFMPNYDGSELEPVVLPSRIPNLLISGSVGIAVGMATNIPPHNLAEVINALIELIKNPNITIEELMNYIKGPDFPTGAIILGKRGIIDTYNSGKGSIIVRSKTYIEVLKNGKSRIIVTEIPYEVKKPLMIEKIAQLAKDKEIEGISDIRDESSKKGIRVVIELKKNVVPEIILNQLFKKTNLQTNYSANIIALVDGEPKTLNLKQALEVYLNHQIEVVTRRIEFDLDKAIQKAHILEGLKIAIENIDDVISIIKKSKNDLEAISKLSQQFNLSEKQAKAVVDMRLGRLTGLAIEKMNADLHELNLEISNYKELLASKEKFMQLLIDELTAIRDTYEDDRRTEIDINNIGDINDEDLIPEKNILITMSAKGYVKRIPLIEYRTQKRGGVGSSTQTTYSDDDVSTIISTSTHSDLLIFTSFGKVYKIRAHQIPELSKQAKGIPFINIINIQNNEKVIALLPIKEYNDNEFLVTITKDGIIKKTSIDQYSKINRSGKIALSMKEGDELLKVIKTTDKGEIIIGANNGKVVRFDIETIRPISRTATGVVGMKFEDNEKAKVIGCSFVSEGDYVLSIGSNGFGKKTPLSEYRQTKRGAKGVKSINQDKSGTLVYVGLVKGNEDIMVVTNKGIVIRTSLESIATTSRATKGVKIINIKDNSKIQSVAILDIESIENDVDDEIIKTNEILANNYSSDSTIKSTEETNIDKNDIDKQDK